jgi:Fe-S-cluster containining protein
MPDVKFELRVGDRTATGTVGVPAEPIRPIDLLPILQKFDDGLIGMAIDETKPVSCCAGCGACCRQLVPISETEALYLADVIDAMPPDRKAHVLARFAQATATLESAGMRERLCPDVTSGSFSSGSFTSPTLSDPAERQKAGMEYFALGLACPFLEEESCSIHPYRPLSCREYLVTSPAANCTDPSPANIKMVPIPAKLSYVLYRFGDGKGEDAPRFLPLPFLLEYAATHTADSQPRVPGPELFGRFFNQLSGLG